MISNEEIVKALLQHKTLKASAESLNISERTIQNRMSDPDFVELFGEAKTEMLRCATLALNEKLLEAVGTVTAIMKDEQAAANIRLQAAQMILNNAFKFTEQLKEAEEKQLDDSGRFVLDIARILK